MKKIGPVLAGQKFGEGMDIRCVRDLNEKEISDCKKFSVAFADIRNKFRLFRIVHLNYEALMDFVKPVPRANRPVAGELEMLECDRLMLNFLTTTKSLLDHFKQYYKRAFRKTPNVDEFDQFLTKLAAQKWPFAFFQDFRNFAQHCGLPTGNVHMRDVDGIIETNVGVDAAWLLETYKEWKVSRLSNAHGHLDLIALTRQYYCCLIQDVAPFLVDAFLPTLIETHTFFAELAAEVAQKAPGYRMILFSGEQEMENELAAHVELIPSDVLGELGIKIKKQGEPPDGQTVVG